MAIRHSLSHSVNDGLFVLEALRNGNRADGRRPTEMRFLRLSFARSEAYATAELQLGRTRVMAVVTAEVVPPFPDRPTEGFLHFNVELSQMASPALASERNSSLAVEIARIIERGVRDSQALDTEALCIVAGEKVWQIRVDVHALDDGGNLIDACALATMAALQHFRKPEVSVSGKQVTVHHSDEREPSPLSLHHVPICVTFALFEDPEASGNFQVGHGPGAREAAIGGGQGVAAHVLVDPSDLEEGTMKGRITYALNVHKELCTLHKNGGTAMSAEAMLTCGKLAAAKVEELHRVLTEALKAADAKARKEREERLRGTSTRAHEVARSTPFVAESEQMEVDPASLKVRHLDYADLHVTVQVREQPEARPRTAKPKAMDEQEASKSGLFQAMTKAAQATEHKAFQSSAAKRGRPSNGAPNAPPVPPQAAPPGTSGPFPAAADEDEFDAFARELSTKAKPPGGSARQPVPPSAPPPKPPLAAAPEAKAKTAGPTSASNGTAAAPFALSDSEEESTVTLQGEFSGVKAQAPRSPRHPVAGAAAAKAGNKGSKSQSAGLAESSDDDDLSAAIRRPASKNKGKKRH